MDPNQALADIQNALEDEFAEAAAMGADGLMCWLRDGGFEPDWSRYPLATQWFKTYRKLETLRQIRVHLGWILPIKFDQTQHLDEARKLLDEVINDLEVEPGDYDDEQEDE